MKGDEQQRHDAETKRYQQQLEQYIHTNLQAGYSVEQIQSYLLEQGYDQESINKSLSHLNKNHYNGSIPVATQHSFKPILIAGIIIVLLAIGSYFLFSSSAFSFVLLLDQSSVELNSPVVLLAETNKEVDLHILVTTMQGNFVLEQREQIKKSQPIYIWLPEDLPLGQYQVTVEQLRSQEEYVFTFSIGSHVQNEKVSELMTALLAQDINLCRNIESILLEDECYFSIAVDTLNEAYCSNIIQPSYRDRCYLTQALNGNMEACELIEDVQTKITCYES